MSTFDVAIYEEEESVMVVKDNKIHNDVHISLWYCEGSNAELRLKMRTGKGEAGTIFEIGYDSNISLENDTGFVVLDSASDKRKKAVIKFANAQTGSRFAKLMKLLINMKLNKSKINDFLKTNTYRMLANVSASTDSLKSSGEFRGAKKTAKSTCNKKYTFEEIKRSCLQKGGTNKTDAFKKQLKRLIKNDEEFCRSLMSVLQKFKML